MQGHHKEACVDFLGQTRKEEELIGASPAPQTFGGAYRQPSVAAQTRSAVQTRQAER